MNEVSIAVWGLGPHAIKNILPALQMSTGIRVRGVCSRNPEIVSTAVEQFGCQGWTRPELMLENPEIDLVYLSTPIGLHAAHGKRVLLAGKHLWCEKPLATNLEEVAALVTLSRDRGVTLAEGFMYLYHPQFFYLQEILRSGRLGDVHSISCRFGIPPLERPGFRINPELGGGAYLDVGSYPISALTALFPDEDPTIRFAEIVNAPGSSVDTHGRAVFGYESGLSATLEWGINCAYRNEIDFWGSMGSVSSERLFSKPANYVPYFRFLDVHGKERHEEGAPANHFLQMFKSFRILMEDPSSAESERMLIARRARIVDRVRDRSLKQGRN